MNGPASLSGQTIVGRYRIVRQLGRGGMGAVFEAIQLSMKRPVAVKLIHPTMAEDPELVARFHREMQVTSKIEHNNTVRVLDFGETEGGQLFLVMELLEGRSLAALLREQGPLPLTRIVHIGNQVLRALAAAHHEGVVHRDLKPENVQVFDRFDERDVVKVLDFGIARVLQPGADAPAMTMEGSLLGTPGYMSPEQAGGRPVGPASDLYAFGVLLYQMATRALPYAGTTLQELLVKQATEPPVPPSAIAPGLVAPPLEALILELLQKDPAARPPSASAVQARLTACLGPAAAGDPLMPAGAGGGTVILDGSGRTTGVPAGHAGTGTAIFSSGAATGARPQTGAGPRPSVATAARPEPGNEPEPDLPPEVVRSPRRSTLPLVAGIVAVLVLVAGGATYGWMRWSRAKAAGALRVELDAALAKDDYPAAPAACRAREPAELTMLLGAATRLADLEKSGASSAAHDALAELEKASAGGGARLAEVWMLLARARLYAKTDAKSAFEAASAAANLCPGWASVQQLRAVSALGAHELDQVGPSFQRAVDAAPDWIAPRKGQGLFLLRSRSYREATVALGKVLDRKPEDLGARLGRAQARLLSGDLEGARADAEEATGRSPDRAEGWLLLGHALAKAQRLEDALSAFCEAKRLGSAEAEKYCTSE